MALWWQYIVIGLLVAGAVSFLAVHFVRKARRKSGGCAGCGLMKAAEKRGGPSNRFPISR